jgi:hypothetical protein
MPNPLAAGILVFSFLFFISKTLSCFPWSLVFVSSIYSRLSGLSTVTFLIATGRDAIEVDLRLERSAAVISDEPFVHVP